MRTNDSDTENDSLAVVAVTLAHERHRDHQRPHRDLHPAADFYGTDTFTYTISDGNGGSGDGDGNGYRHSVNDGSDAGRDCGM